MVDVSYVKPNKLNIALTNKKTDKHKNMTKLMF